MSVRNEKTNGRQEVKTENVGGRQGWRSSSDANNDRECQRDRRGIEFLQHHVNH